MYCLIQDVASNARSIAGPTRTLVPRNVGRRATKRRTQEPSPRPNVPHRSRPAQPAAYPVHITLRSRLAPLRSQFLFPSVRLALTRAARRDPDRFRITHYSVQRDHVHLIVEATNKRTLSSGIRSIAIRIARYVNDLLSRRGPPWADRFHSRTLTSPREVRNAIVYVLANFRKHTQHDLRPGLDPYSSAGAFDGWREWQPQLGTPPPFAERKARFEDDANTSLSIDAAGFGARTWLARVGWRMHSLISISETPAG